VSTAGTIPSLLTARLRSDAASPFVTFYDDATGERVELSAITFANWVAKTANMLGDEFGLVPGEIARIALPLHWQSLVVAAASWEAGLVVDTSGLAAAPSIAFVAETAVSDVADDARDVVALSLRPMGGRLQVPNPAVVDYAAEVLAHGDRYLGPALAPADLAIPTATHADLLTMSRSHLPGARILLAPDGDPALDVESVIAAYLGPLASGGSVVLCRNADPAALPRRLAAERAVVA
jgi:uncharacterized protein (TIGR03089 family)